MVYVIPVFGQLEAGLGRNLFHPDPACKLSENWYDVNHYCVYSEKLLTMDRGNVRNMQSFTTR